MQKNKNEKGITLIILVITIIVLMLISVPVLVNTTQVTKANKYTKFKADMESLTESIGIAYSNKDVVNDIGPKYTGNTSFLTSDVKNPNDSDTYYVIDITILNSKLSTKLDELNYGSGNKNYKTSSQYNSTDNTFSGDDVYIVNSISKTVYYTNGMNYNGKIYYKLPEEYSNITVEYPQYIADGSWNLSKNVNTPKLEGTGLIPIYFDGNNVEHELTINSSNAEWNKWYDYSEATGTGDYTSNRWANAITKDEKGNTTGYFVWIPRFAYRITSGCNTSTSGTIKVKFLQATSDQDENGNTIKETYPTVTSGAMADYVVHPAFTTNVANGGWDKNIEGFWVAKYPAGYQKSTLTENGTTVSTTISNSGDTLVESYKNYTGIDNSYKLNAVNASLSTSTKMSYPVFKPLTYAYNCIRIGDIYTLSRDIQNANSFYGLNNIDSHMQKNSEWGAVAYLTQSSYGRNGTEVNVNSYNMNNTNLKNTYCVTGLYSDGTSAANVTSISSLKAYNDATVGVKGSSTGNITGVYDLNGCIWERVASYITNENPSLSTYGSSFAYTTADATPQTNARSTKWATAYPYDSSSDANTSNWTKYNSFKSATYGFGDAILETSTSGSGSTSWNGDYSGFPYTGDPFFFRGGAYDDGGSFAGAFSFYGANGYCSYGNGFRVVLVA